MKKALVCLILSVAGLISLSSVLLAGTDVSGTYTTNFNELTIEQKGNAVTGTYKFKNGRIEGTLDGYRLSGRWHQSNGKGKLVFEFKPDGSGFSGKWGYNDAVPSGRWDGTRMTPKSKRASVPPGMDVTGVYDTDFKVLTLRQNGSQVSGSYTYRDGRIEGTLSGYTLTGRWTQSNGEGRILFEFKPDGSGFSGKWGYNEAAPTGKWNGAADSAKTARLIRSIGQKATMAGPAALDRAAGTAETQSKASSASAGVNPTAAAQPGQPATAKTATAAEAAQSTQATNAKPLSDGWEDPMAAFKNLPPLPPLSSMLSQAKAAPVAPRLDPAAFSNMQYLGAVSAVKAAMEELRGPMSPAAKEKFEAQWAAIYDYPADACVAYLNAASPLLGEILSLRASMMKIFQGYDNFINQAKTARFFGNHAAAHELMRRAGQHAALMKALQRTSDAAVAKLTELGDLPDAALIKARVAEQYRASKNLLKALSKPPQLSGEYEPAAYAAIQDPYKGHTRKTPDPSLLRLDKDPDYDPITYLLPLKAMGDNLVLVYLCETDTEGNKSSWIQLFEKQADGSLAGYNGGCDLRKLVLQVTEDGFRKIEYTIEPKDISGDNNDFSEEMAALIAKHKMPKIELVHSLRSRTYYANDVQYQNPPTDDEFDWNTWENLVRKHQKEILAEFQGQRQAFETLAQGIAFPEVVPAENVYWVFERMETENKHPVLERERALDLINPGARAVYMEVMKRKDGFEPWPLVASRQQTDLSEAGLVNVDERTVFDNADNKKISYDNMTITHRISWKSPPPVIAQAGGIFAMDIAAQREASAPRQRELVPSPFAAIVVSARSEALDAGGKYAGDGGQRGSISLLAAHAQAGPGKVNDSGRVECLMDEPDTDYAAVNLYCSADESEILRSRGVVGSLFSGGGLRYFYKRKIMTPDEAAELAAQMGDTLNTSVAKARAGQQQRTDQAAAARARAKEQQAAVQESIDFHQSTIAYEQQLAAKYQQELETELQAVKASGKPPTEEQLKRISALRFNIIGARSNAIAEQDTINELKTGTYQRSETPFDSMCRLQFRQNIEKNIRRIEALESQQELAEKYIEFLPQGERSQAYRTLQKIRDESPDDYAKYRKLNAALKSKWQGATEAKFAEMDEDMAWKDAQLSAIENIKTGADVGLMACSMMGGPQAIALTYQFTSGWAEKDFLTGVKQSVTMYSDAVDIAWSTYDGYCQGGWEGAAKAGGVSILTNLGLPYLMGKMGKNGEFPDINTKAAGNLADGAKAAKGVDDIPLVMKNGKLQIDDVKRYEAELAHAEKQVKDFVSDYHAWRKGVKEGLPEKEIEKLHKKVIDATASINSNPAAKGYLKYKAPPATGRFFDKSLDTIHDNARNVYYETMKKAGYSDHEIFAIRNASSSGTTGMDFDQALKEQPDWIRIKNKDGSTTLQRNVWLTKNGQPVSRHQWQMDAQAAWNDAYKKATNGASAPVAWEKMTTKVDPEAYRMMSVLKINKDLSNVEEIMDTIDPKWVRQMSDVTMFKAGEMLKDENLSRLAGVREACRGTAKDMDGKFLPFINSRLSSLKKIPAAKQTASDKHNIKRLESALESFTRVRNSFDAIGKAKIPPCQWDDAINLSTGGKGIMQTIQDLSDLTQSLFM